MLYCAVVHGSHDNAGPILEVDDILLLNSSHLKNAALYQLLEQRTAILFRLLVG